jgi:tripartite-type tricarboxylate transporter receptor subunit TctC
VTPVLAVNPHLWRNVRYDVLKDFDPVVQLVNSRFVLSLRSSLPVNSVKELIAFAKAQGSRLAYTSSGVGSANQVV